MGRISKAKNAQLGKWSKLGIHDAIVLSYIRLQSCPKGNITWRKPNITAKQYNSLKANITENTGRDSFAFSPLAKIKVRLGPALAGGARPRCI